MKTRSPALVILLSFITFGIYGLVWLVKTKGEMNRLGARIPSAWMMLIPFIGPLLFLWKWAGGAEHVTRGQTGAAVAFLLCALLGPIGFAILQSSFNKRGMQPAGSGYASAA